jgi:hypothetical protein
MAGAGGGGFDRCGCRERHCGRPLRIRPARRLDDPQPGDLDEATVKYVRDNDGVYMFGDSISVQDGKALRLS